VTHHGYKIKYFLLGNNITSKVLTLLKSKQKHLVLAAIRFFRSFIGMKEDFYNKHLIKKNLFDPIIEVFKENGAKYNLLNSAIIELFEFIRKENVKPLIQHVVERYGDFFKTVEYVDTFKHLLLKNEQNQENSSASSTPTLSANSLNGSREVQDDEDYFNSEEEENPVPIKRFEKDIERQFKPLIRKVDDDDSLILPKLKNNDSTDGKKGKIILNLIHVRDNKDSEIGNETKKRKTSEI